MDIRTLAERISVYAKLLEKGTLSEIERDILLSDLRQLYLLARENNSATHIVISETPVVSELEPTIQTAPVEEKIEPIAEERTKPIIEFVKEEPVVQKVQEAPKIETTPVAEATPATPKAEEDTIHLETRRIHYHEGTPVRGPKPTSLNEVFTGEERSLNAMAGGDKKKALNDRISGTDLNSLLDLNRKHVLTNELFGGDSQAFQTAIRRINESPTIEDAFEYIKTDLLPKYQWKGDMQSAKLFDKLVRQKFGL